MLSLIQRLHDSAFNVWKGFVQRDDEYFTYASFLALRSKPAVPLGVIRSGLSTEFMGRLGPKQQLILKTRACREGMGKISRSYNCCLGTIRYQLGIIL